MSGPEEKGPRPEEVTEISAHTERPFVEREFHPGEYKIVLMEIQEDKIAIHHTIHKSRTVIGRTGVDLSFDDPLISRKHAALEVYSREYVFLRDLASTNGTFVNDHMVTQVKLRPGDTIRVGRVSLRYWIGPEAARVSEDTCSDTGES